MAGGRLGTATEGAAGCAADIGPVGARSAKPERHYAAPSRPDISAAVDCRDSSKRCASAACASGDIFPMQFEFLAHQREAALRALARLPGKFLVIVGTMKPLTFCDCGQRGNVEAIRRAAAVQRITASVPRQ